MDDKTKVKQLTEAWAVLLRLKNGSPVSKIILEDTCNKIDEIITDIVNQGI